MMRTRLDLLAMCVLGVSVAAGGCGVDGGVDERGAGGRPSRVEGAVVYGEDDRVDWYEVPAESDRALARGASVAMVPYTRIRYEEDGGVTLTSSETLGERQDLCAAERFREDPTSGACSGTLIDDDLVLTAGHCIEDLDDCARHAFVFDYLHEAPGERPGLDRDDVYRCAAVVMQGGADTAERLDVAIVQLERPVVGRAPAAVARFVASGDAAAGTGERAPLVAGEALWMVGYPSGIPMKIDAGGTVASARAAEMDYFVASVDAFRGNSGSGVFDANRLVVGVLTDGAEDYMNLGSCRGVVVLDAADAEEGVHYAHRAVETLCAKGFPSERLCGLGAGTCGDGFCEVRERGAEASEAGEACAEDCSGLWEVPPEWTCSSRWYARGDDCDCDCGVRDPDCDDLSLDIYGCATGSACSDDGVCEVRVPEEWTCRDSWYAVGDDCDCNCGTWDPDCADASLRTFGCVGDGSCMEDGRCSTGPPEGWTCAPRRWGSGDGCQCGCGAWDPDCAGVAAADVEGCAVGSGCMEDGTCEVAVPDGWVCDDALYGAGERCDCNCGAPDPDCENLGALVLNCGAGAGCGPSGECVAGGGSADGAPEAVADAGGGDAEIGETDAGPETVADVEDSGGETAGDSVGDSADEVTDGRALDAETEVGDAGDGSDDVAVTDVVVTDVVVTDVQTTDVAGRAETDDPVDADTGEDGTPGEDAGVGSGAERAQGVARRRVAGGGGGCGGGTEGVAGAWWLALVYLGWFSRRARAAR